MDARGLIVAGALVTAAILGAGCGGEEGDAELAPAAEPVASPPVAVDPVGNVVEVGGEIEGLAFDPRTRTLAAVARDPGLLSLIDGRTLDVRTEVEVGEGSRHLQLAAPGGPVLVPAQFTDQLMSVELPSGDLVTTEVGESPHDAAAIGDRVYVGDEGGDTLTVVADGKAKATIEAPVQPGAVEAVAGWIAVVAVAERVLAVFDPASFEQVAEVPAGAGPTHAAALGNRLFVADTQGNAIIEYEVGGEGTPVEAATLPLEGSPYGLAVDSRRERLWVTATARNEVVEVALGAGRLDQLRAYPTVRQPNSVAVDQRSGKVFVASRTDGTVQAFDPAAVEPSQGGADAGA